MRFIVSVFLWIGLCAALTNPALADERIREFNVQIQVEKNGDIGVTETIIVNVEGMQIRRGIFRDLPRFYDLDGDKLPYIYTVKSIMRDGQKEKYKRENDGNALRLRIGDANVFLDKGIHTYTIHYSVKNQIRYFGDYDELYWNATGTFWAFPIDKARVRISVPEGVRFLSESAYTGARGETGQTYQFQTVGDDFEFETTQPLDRYEGLTISLSFEKGGIDPPSSADRRGLWWTQNKGLMYFIVTFLGVFLFYFRRWAKYGRDPQAGPVFPQYEPPEGYSPAALSYIHYKGIRGHKPLVATLIALATKGWIDIDASEKKKTVLKALGAAQDAKPAFDDERVLFRKLFKKVPSTLTLRRKPHATFNAAYNTFRKSLMKQYSSKYHKYNMGTILIGTALSVVGVIIALANTYGWKTEYLIALLAVGVMNILFWILMPAPTQLGAKIQTHIKGFRLYLKTAEALQLNAADIGGDAPPPMSKERYERFLPYAVALGVEKPWSKYFEATLPQEAADYNPGWAHLRGGDVGSATRFADALGASISSGVSGAAPASSSSSGSSGGGFSGGGGGGGGGGGW